MFFHRGVFIIKMFFYAVMDEACRATNIYTIIQYNSLFNHVASI